MRHTRTRKRGKAVQTMNIAKNTVDHWLAQRIPGAALDASGIATIRRDEDTVIVLEVPPDSDVCHLCALVAPLPEVAREAALMAALELNRFGRPLGGCWLAWEDEVQMLTLCHNVLVPATDAIGFGNTLDNFLMALDYAREQLLVADATAGIEGHVDEHTDLADAAPYGALHDLRV